MGVIGKNLGGIGNTRLSALQINGGKIDLGGVNQYDAKSVARGREGRVFGFDAVW
jgi:hypothetical protein